MLLKELFALKESVNEKELDKFLSAEDFACTIGSDHIVLYTNEPSVRMRDEDGYDMSPAEMDHDGQKLRVSFSDKHAFLKSLLTIMKESYPDFVKEIISRCKKAGYDYPEFKAIEKSIGSK